MGPIPKRWLVILLLVALIGAGFVVRIPLGHIVLPAEHVFDLFGFPVTNTMITAFLASALLVIFSFSVTRKMEMVPTGAQNVLEMAIESLLDLVEDVAGRRWGRQFFPLVATIFLFILVANYMGLLPGYGTIGIVEHEAGETVLVPLFRSSSTDLNVTIGLALIAVTAVQFFGVKAVGVKAYVSRFINFSGPIEFFMGLLEIISEFARIISLSFRLFGNVFAGEVLLTVISFLIPFVAVLPFYGLELFVGAIQALIFAMLTLVFLTLASMEHGGEGHEAQEGAH
ncbi:MAG: F0F1 ATP synthase subunit A [Chloroflexota bacterium]